MKKKNNNSIPKLMVAMVLVISFMVSVQSISAESLWWDPFESVLVEGGGVPCNEDDPNPCDPQDPKPKPENPKPKPGPKPGVCYFIPWLCSGN